ncbi:basic proline-rich protein-like [Apus apus]|uniref:basic proline-rich protein-like n=1 Tax=Apus apus TaxID=8895 RepID=UPI0021F882C2|nr:basic proline-rich protein-like [Apus apus]
MDVEGGAAPGPPRLPSGTSGPPSPPHLPAPRQASAPASRPGGRRDQAAAGAPGPSLRAAAPLGPGGRCRGAARAAPHPAPAGLLPATQRDPGPDPPGPPARLTRSSRAPFVPHRAGAGSACALSSALSPRRPQPAGGCSGFYRAGRLPALLPSEPPPGRGLTRAAPGPAGPGGIVANLRDAEGGGCGPARRSREQAPPGREGALPPARGGLCPGPPLRQGRRFQHRGRLSRPATARGSCPPARCSPHSPQGHPPASRPPPSRQPGRCSRGPGGAAAPAAGGESAAANKRPLAPRARRHLAPFSPPRQREGPAAGGSGGAAAPAAPAPRYSPRVG